MNSIPERLVVHAKDAAVIVGVHERTACRLLDKIRKHYGRAPRTYVTIEDFCGYTRLRREEVRMFLK